MGDEVVILPDDVKPGDLIECHGARQRVTYEFGAYALVKVEGRSIRCRGGGPEVPGGGPDKPH